MKQLAKLALVGLLALSSLDAKEILFDLKAQDFKNTLDKSGAARYKVSDSVMVDTNMKLVDGTYQGTGYFNITLTNPVSDWKASYDFVTCFLSRPSKRFIKFTDDFGETVVLSFDNQGFNINGKEYKANTDQALILLNVSVIDKKLVVKVNNQLLFNESIAFDKLKFIDSNFYHYEFTRGRYDTLNKIVLVSND